MTWKLQRTTQCSKCPWKVSTDPTTIPNGYDVEKHKALKDTIAKPADVRGLLGGDMKAMACHEEHEAHCIGWLMHQLGPGNNLGLRLKMMSCENANQIKLAGKQHQQFEDTLPDTNFDGQKAMGSRRGGRNRAD